jgi:hypothetical protein
MGIGSEDVSKVSDTWKDVQAQAAAMVVGAAMEMEIYPVQLGSNYSRRRFISICIPSLIMMLLIPGFRALGWRPVGLQVYDAFAKELLPST